MNNSDYAQGFKDGWKAAMEEMEKMPPNRNHLQPHMWKDLKIDPPPGTYNKCPVCGAIGIRFEVCYNEKCPSRITVGAVGAGGTVRNLGAGANGPSGTFTTDNTGGWGSKK